MQHNHIEIETIYRAIKDAAQEIANYLRYRSALLVESLNPFGKQQSQVDIESDKIIEKHLLKTGVVYAYISEEQAEMKIVNEDGTYIVSYDPIDGNIVLDVNMSVSSIFGIWHSKTI